MATILYSPITRDFAIKNYQWNGLSEFTDLLVKDGFSVSIYKDKLRLKSLSPSGTCILIIGPEIPYEADEAESLLNFVKDGGTVILLDDFGTGNTLLERLEIPVKFIGKPLLDEVVYSKQPVFPIIVGLTDELKALNITIITNIPTALEVLNSSTTEWEVAVVAKSSEHAFIDHNFNEKLDDGEVKGQYPAVVVVKKRRGRIVLISDPSILINCMIDEGDNYRFVKLILSRYRVRRVVIDYSHYEKRLVEYLRERLILFLKRAKTTLRDPLFSYTLTIFIVTITLTTIHSIVKRCKREHI